MNEFKVDGMTCNHCVKAVTTAIHDVDANAKVDIDLGAKKVRVDSQLATDKISSAITEAGYTVVSAAAN